MVGILCGESGFTRVGGVFGLHGIKLGAEGHGASRLVPARLWKCLSAISTSGDSLCVVNRVILRSRVHLCFASIN